MYIVLLFLVGFRNDSVVLVHINNECKSRKTVIRIEHCQVGYWTHRAVKWKIGLLETIDIFSKTTRLVLNCMPTLHIRIFHILMMTCMFLFTDLDIDYILFCVPKRISVIYIYIDILIVCVASFVNLITVTTF